MNEPHDVFFFYISDWDIYRPNLGCVENIIKKYPGDKKLGIRSYESEGNLTFIVKGVDVESKELLQELCEWRAEHFNKVFVIGLEDSILKSKRNLISLKKLLENYHGNDIVHIHALDQNKTLELKTIRIDSINPGLQKELFNLMDEQEEYPF